MITGRTFTLCDYFDKAGRRVDRYYIVEEAGDAAIERVRELIRKGHVERVFDAMFADASDSKTTTALPDAALALNLILNEVADRRVALAVARRIASIGINLQQPVTIAEIMPALELEFGGIAVSWARSVFSHLNLGSPHLH